MQVSAGTSWTNHVGNEEGHSVAATLEALPLRVGGLPTVLLAAGANSAVFLSERGQTLETLELPVHLSVPFCPVSALKYYVLNEP